MFFENKFLIERPSRKFWDNSRDWPEDCREYIFAGRAISQLGHKRFGNEWSDLCPATELIEELPVQYDIRTDPAEIELAVRLLENSNGRTVVMNALMGTVPCFPSKEDWQVARKLATEARREAWNRYKPFAVIASDLANAARDGKLVTALCHRMGGEMAEQAWHFWNYPGRWLRFELCRVPKDAHAMFCEARDQNFRWIYLRRDSFDELLESDAQSVNHTASDAVARDVAQKTAKKRGGGRPTEYNWTEFAGELFKRHVAGELPNTCAGIASLMAEWCGNAWGREPTDSQLREKIGILLAGIVSAKN